MITLAVPVSSIKGLAPEIISSLIVMFIIAVLSFVVYFKARKVDPLKKPKGIMIVAEQAVSFIDSLVYKEMGPQFLKIAPYIGFICMYIFLCFVIGLTGLPSPMTNLMVPLSISLITFLAIHVVSAIYTKWKYYKRYLSPFAVFLPINLVSMWAPIISLTFRLFGNALSGWVLMYIVYSALEGLSTAIFSMPYFIAPFITPFLHAYFDIFSGFIQSTIFVILTMLFVAGEVPEEEEVVREAVVN